MRRISWLLGLVGILIVPSLTAQTGLLVVAHGADSAWNARVQATMAQVRWSDGPVRLASMMGPEAETASMETQSRALATAGARRVVVVPLMVSSFGGHTYDIQHAAAGHSGSMSGQMPGMAAHRLALPPAIAVQVTSALDSSSELGLALLARWRELPAGDRARPLVLVAHGPNSDVDALRWIDNLRAATRGLAAVLPDRAVHIGLLRDDAPAPVRAGAVAGIRDTISALFTQRGDSVMVMTVLISSGAINNRTVPADLAGIPMHYAGAALAPDPAIARWIERVASAVRW